MVPSAGPTGSPRSEWPQAVALNVTWRKVCAPAATFGYADPVGMKAAATVLRLPDELAAVTEAGSPPAWIGALAQGAPSVSYTHLTLPTKRIV